MTEPTVTDSNKSTKSKISILFSWLLKLVTVASTVSTNPKTKAELVAAGKILDELTPDNSSETPH